MKNLTALIVGLSLALLAGCGDDSSAPGQEGGSCRIGANPCDEGLRCNGGICVTGEEEEPSEDLTVEFVLERERIPADGAARLVVEMLVTETESGANFDGQLLVYPNPSTAGRIEPGSVVFEDGLGFFEYISCNRAVDLECPNFVTVNAARPDDPLNPIASSPQIRLDDPVPESGE